MKLLKTISAVTMSVAVAALLTTMVGHAYTTFSQWAYSPVTFYLNPTSTSISADAAETAVKAAAAAWTNQTHASFAFYYGGRVTDTSIAHDSRNVVIFRQDPDSGGGLGTTYSWMSGYRFLESDVVFWEGVYPYFVGTSGCTNGGSYLEDIATHEMGHALGMGHSSIYPTTMYPYYDACTQTERNLHADDIAGVESLYPPPAGTPTPPVVTVSNPVNGATAVQGTPIAFAGTATDAKDGDITSKLVWVSNLDGQLGTGGSVSATLSAGSHVVTASAVDSSSLTGSNQVSVTITVPPPPCVRAVPTVSLAPGTVSVVAGTSQSYTVNVTNNDSSICGASSFNLASAVPTGWGASLGTILLPVAVASTASTTLSVTAPSGTPLASYPLGATATNSAATSYRASASATETIIADPTIPSVTVSPTAVLGSKSATATLTLSAPAPAGGATINLASSNTSVATVPASVLVSAGTTIKTFTVTTVGVGTATDVTISAAYPATAAGVTAARMTAAGATVASATAASATLRVNPPVPTRMALSSSSTVGGKTLTGTVTVSASAPVGGLAVALASSNMQAATVPASVTILQGKTSATFTVTTLGVSSPATTAISASKIGTTVQATLTVNPATLSSVAFNPTSVAGGGTVLGTITLSGAAPSTGAEVALTSSVIAGQVPASVTIAAGATSGTFTVQTSPVLTDSNVAISAVYLSVTKAVTLTVRAPDAAVVSLDPPSVQGGVSSTGTVTLTGPAPAGGTLVTLKSGSTGATFPAGTTVTVPDGATSAQFVVATMAVTASKSITITATAGGVSKSAVLTVTP